jgi:acyl-CoA thioesterase-1
MLKDGIHPNGEGVAVIVENMLPKVEELLAARPPEGGS